MCCISMSLMTAVILQDEMVVPSFMMTQRSGLCRHEPRHGQLGRSSSTLHILSWSICDLNPQLPALNTRDPSDTRRIFSKLTQGHLRYPNGSRWPWGTTVSSAFSVVRWYYFMAPRLQRSNTPVGPLVPHGCMACEAAGHWNGEQRGSTR